MFNKPVIVVYANSEEYDLIQKKSFERIRDAVLKELDYRSPDTLLTPEEAAEFLGMDRKNKNRMYHLQRDGLPYYKIEGGGNRYMVKDLIKYRESRRVVRK